MIIKFFATYRDLTGLRETDIPAPATVWDLVVGLAEVYGEPVAERMLNAARDDLGRDLILLVNGVNIVHKQGKETPLSESDLVVIFPMVAGG
jgi:molybdopterin synthase sulfur carrier subunit